MFLLHAIYGLGAMVSPLVSTEFVKSLPDRVYLYFAVSLGLAIFTVICLLVVFRLRTEDQIVGKRQVDAHDSGHRDLSMAETDEEKRLREKREKAYGDGGSGSKMKRIMKTPAVHYMAFYILIYVSYSRVKFF
jgi:hypothetical protein